jgi:hypothetical protein
LGRVFNFKLCCFCHECNYKACTSKTTSTVETLAHVLCCWLKYVHWLKCTNRQSIHALPVHWIHKIIWHEFTISWRPKARVFWINSKWYFHKYCQNLVNPLCSKVMLVFYLPSSCMYTMNCMIQGNDCTTY